jgi:hypothetical protein
MNEEYLDLWVDEDGESGSLVFDDKDVPGIEGLEFNLDLDFNRGSVFDDLGVEVNSEAIEEEIKSWLPVDLDSGEFNFVVFSDVNNLDVVVGDEFSGVDFESLNPVDGEGLKVVFVVYDNSCFSGNIEFLIVGLDLGDGDFNLNDDVILILDEEFGVNSVNFGLDLDFVGLDLENSIKSEHLDLGVNVDLDLESEGNESLFSLGFDGNGKGLNVDVDFFGNDLHSWVSPDPKVGGFSLNVNGDSLSNDFNLDSGLFFKSVDDEDGLSSDLIYLNLDFNVHLQLEFDDDFMGVFGDGFNLDADGQVPFGLKINNDLDVMGINSIDFDDVVEFEISDVVDIDDVESLLFISEENVVVGGDSFDFDLEFELKWKGKSSNDFLIFNFNVGNENCSFFGDLNSDFFDSGNGFSLNDKGLVDKPFSPFDLEVNNLFME